MRFTAFKGRTCFEAQLGKYWIKILRPKFWGLGLKLVKVGVQEDGEDLS